MRQFDVAIIGAGPAGSATAITLAGLGERVLLLDRARFPRYKLCGDFLNPVSWPVLEDLGVADAVQNAAHVKIARFRLSAANGETAGGPLPPRNGLRCALGIPRYVLDHLLLSRAKRLGVTVAEGRNVLQARREKAGWAIKYRGPAGDETRHARLLAGADGRYSRIARQLRLDRAVTQPHASIGFQIRLRMTSGLEDSVQIHQFGGGYAGLVRLDAETVNLCFTVEQSLAGKGLSFECLRDNYLLHNPMLRRLMLQGQPRSSLRSIWPVYFPPRQRYGDGFVLVGDAAQVTEPISGEGIYFALRSGQLAAHALSAARRAGEPSLMKLAQYDTACNEEFGARMRLNRCMRIVMRHPVLLGPSLALLRRQMLFDALLRRVCG